MFEQCRKVFARICQSLDICFVRNPMIPPPGRPCAIREEPARDSGRSLAYPTHTFSTIPGRERKYFAVKLPITSDLTETRTPTVRDQPPATRNRSSLIVMMGCCSCQQRIDRPPQQAPQLAQCLLRVFALLHESENKPFSLRVAETKQTVPADHHQAVLPAECPSVAVQANGYGAPPFLRDGGSTL